MPSGWTRAALRITQLQPSFVVFQSKYKYSYVGLLYTFLLPYFDIPPRLPEKCDQKKLMNKFISGSCSPPRGLNIPVSLSNDHFMFFSTRSWKFLLGVVVYGHLKATVVDAYFRISAGSWEYPRPRGGDASKGPKSGKLSLSRTNRLLKMLWQDDDYNCLGLSSKGETFQQTRCLWRLFIFSFFISLLSGSFELDCIRMERLTLS